jgi:hypothetical protein
MVNAVGKILIAGVAGTIALATPAYSQSDDAVEYTFVKGDTLYGLARDYFVSDEAALEVQRLNGIKNDRRIPVGAVVSVPRSLLKWDPVTLEVASFTGDVSVGPRGSSRAPVKGQTIGENTIISTRARSFISLQGAGRTAVSLPSNSSVQIRRAKRYRINNALDVDLRVLRGRGEIRAPKLRNDERFRTGTPLAVTAVRGTDFRVGYDEASALALTEVTEGLVEISNDGASIAAAAGTGVATDPAGLGKPEELLSAPEMVDRNAIQTDETLTFAVNPLDGAAAYRVQIARDQTFTDVIDEQVSPATEFEFELPEDGRFAVRARATAKSGLEGFWQGGDPSFRRKRVGVSASAEPAPFADAYKFAWLPAGSGPSYTAFQMWRQDAPETLVIDEVGLDNGGFYVVDLAPGAYFWRIGTSVIDEGEVIKIWNEPLPLNVTE